MNQRIHRHLDGDLPRTLLTEEERREADAYRVAIRSAVFPVLGEEPLRVAGAVRAAIEKAPAPGASRSTPRVGPLRALAAHLWRPRSVSLRVRPAWVLALAAAAVAFAAWPRGAPAPAGNPIQEGGTVTAVATEGGRVLVRFRLEVSDAGSVRLAGDFTGWKPGPALEQVAPGIWTVAVPITPGLHDYAFLVDGSRWVQDPLAERVDDGFGGSNSRVAVLAPTGAGEV